MKTLESVLSKLKRQRTDDEPILNSDRSVTNVGRNENERCDQPMAENADVNTAGSSPRSPGITVDDRPNKRKNFRPKSFRSSSKETDTRSSPTTPTPTAPGADDDETEINVDVEEEEEDDDSNSLQDFPLKLPNVLINSFGASDTTSLVSPKENSLPSASDKANAVVPKVASSTNHIEQLLKRDSERMDHEKAVMNAICLANPSLEHYIARFMGSDCRLSNCPMSVGNREHFHCKPCSHRLFTKKEEMLRHYKWHRKREESLAQGFMRYSASDNCASAAFPNCIHNSRQTHYHCLQPGCDKVYISTSDVQMHANSHRKAAHIAREGFQRFKATEDCKFRECPFRDPKHRTTHFHCLRIGCTHSFKNKSDMDKHKAHHLKDEQLIRDGFKKFMKSETCYFSACAFSKVINHIHCIRPGCDYVLHSTSQMYSHKRKHEKQERSGLNKETKAIDDVAPDLTNEEEEHSLNDLPSNAPAMTTGNTPSGNTPDIPTILPALPPILPLPQIPINLNPFAVAALLQNMQMQRLQQQSLAQLGSGQEQQTRTPTVQPLAQDQNIKTEPTQPTQSTPPNDVQQLPPAVPPNASVRTPSNELTDATPTQTLLIPTKRPEGQPSTIISNTSAGKIKIKLYDPKAQNFVHLETIYPPNNKEPLRRTEEEMDGGEPPLTSLGVGAFDFLQQPISMMPALDAGDEQQEELKEETTAASSAADFWRKYMIRYTANDPCRPLCPMMYKDHYHCISGCAATFRNKEGVREHSRQHELLDQATEKGFILTNSTDDGECPIKGTNCKYRGDDKTHYHCTKTDCDEAIGTADAVFRRLEHFRVHGFALSGGLQSLSSSSSGDAKSRKRGRPPKPSADGPTAEVDTSSDSANGLVTNGNSLLIRRGRPRTVSSPINDVAGTTTTTNTSTVIGETENPTTAFSPVSSSSSALPITPTVPPVLCSPMTVSASPDVVGPCAPSPMVQPNGGVQTTQLMQQAAVNLNVLSMLIPGFAPAMLRAPLPLSINGGGAGQPSLSANLASLIANNFLQRSSVIANEQQQQQQQHKPSYEGFVTYAPNETCPDSSCQYKQALHYHCSAARCFYATDVASAETLDAHRGDFHASVEIPDGYACFDRRYRCHFAQCPHAAATAPRHFHCMRPGCGQSFVKVNALLAHEPLHANGSATTKDSVNASDNGVTPVQFVPTSAAAAVIKTAGTYYPIDSLPVITTATAATGGPVQQTATADSQPLADDDSTLLPRHYTVEQQCGRPFCKLKRRRHYHCNSCSQGFSNAGRLLPHLQKHGITLQPEEAAATLMVELASPVTTAHHDAGNKKPQSDPSVMAASNSGVATATDTAVSTGAKKVKFHVFQPANLKFTSQTTLSEPQAATLQTEGQPKMKRLKFVDCTQETVDAATRLEALERAATPPPPGFGTFTNRSDCGMPGCLFATSHPVHFHCLQPGCGFAIWDRRKLSDHADSHSTVDNIPANTTATLADTPSATTVNGGAIGVVPCPLSHCQGAPVNGVHFHCAKCEFLAADRTKMALHVNHHDRRDQEAAMGFVKKCCTEMEPCNYLDSACRHTSIHYHCLLCRTVAFNVTDMAAHRENDHTARLPAN